MPSRGNPRKERRRSNRVAAAIRMKVQRYKSSPQEDFGAETVNLSLGGVGVRLRPALEIGTRLRLTFLDLEPTGRGFRVDGRVIWRQFEEETGEYLTGVELLTMTEEQLRRLMLLIDETAWSEGAPAEPAHIHLPESLVVEYRAEKGWPGRRWNPASCHEISLRTLALVTEEKLPVGEDLRLRALLPDGNPDPLPFRGTVLDKQKDSMPGEWDTVVRINEIADKNRLRLAAFLSRQIMM